MRDDLASRSDAYFSAVLGASVRRGEGGLHVTECARRLASEEGYGGAWPAYVLKQGMEWWLSIAPGLPASIPSVVERAYATGRYDSTLASELSAALLPICTIRYGGHALLFIPSQAPEPIVLPAGCVVRPITMPEKPRNVPDESVEAGTAFGVFVDGTLVCWAEATPLPTVTPQFGVTLVGIETAEGYRRRGFAHVALTALTRYVLDMGNVPLYSCASTNLASQRTALSCGYRLYAESIRLQL
jgi:hypothetical protein